MSRYNPVLCHNSGWANAPREDSIIIINYNNLVLLAVSASRLVKSPDSHVSDPCSRLGGSSWLCYGIYFISEFNEMPEIFWRHLAWKAESSLSEDELSRKVLGPAVYTKIYCRVQRNRVLFIPVQWENRVTLTMKWIQAGRQFPMIKQLPWQLAVNRGAVGESRTSGRRGKTPWGKPVSAINTVRKSQAASRWGPWKFRPSTAYDALLPHTRVQARVPGHWVGYILSCAWTPYLGWANEPRAE